MSRAAMITGIGVVAPTGVGADEHWRNSLAGRSGITRVDAGLPVGVAGQVSGFDETQWVPHRLIVQTDRWTWLALVAVQLAVKDAALDTAKQLPMGLSVITASGSGGNLFGQREIQALWQGGPGKVSAYQSIGWFYAASTGQISIRHQFKGACGVLVSDGAGGIDAAWQARRLLIRGGDGAVVGGTEAPLSPYAMVCQGSRRELSRGLEPATAYRPFATDATGHVPGEGGAMMVVEPWCRARARGARMYAEIAGAAATQDAWHPDEPAPDCRQLARAMREAIARAECGPDDIDAVFADGAGHPVGDRLEADALRAVFGSRRVPVTVPKTMTGRLCSGGAALDLAWAALAIHHGVLPPSVNVAADSVGHGLDLVTEARAGAWRRVLVVARGAGGFNSAAVLREPGGRLDR